MDKEKNSTSDHICPEFVNEEFTGVTEEEELCAKKRTAPRRQVPRYVFIVITLLALLAFAGGGIWYYHENVLPEKYFLKAEANFERENYSEALSFYVKALKIRPERKDVFYNAAICCEKLGRNDDAIVFYKEHLRGVKKDSRALSRLGWLYMNKGQYVEALKVFEEAAGKEKDRFDFWHLMSRAAEKAGDREKLVLSLEKSVALAAESDASIAAAKKLMELAEWEKALSAFCKAAEKFPEDKRALHGAHAAAVMLGAPADIRLMIVPGISLGRVKIGAEKSEVLALLGEPSQNIAVPREKNRAAEIWVYNRDFFKGRGIRIIFEGNSVCAVEAFSDEYRTGRGIGLSNFLMSKNAERLSVNSAGDKDTAVMSLKEGGVTFYASGISQDGESAKYKKLSLHKRGTREKIANMIKKLSD